MLSSCGAGEDLRVPWTARKSKQSVLKEVNPRIHWKNWCWSWSSNTLPIWCEELTHWKRCWCWERLMARREGGNRGWDGQMASLTDGHEFEQTPGKPGMLQFLGSQRVGHDLATEHTQAYLKACQIQSQWVLSLQQMNWEKRGDSIHDSFHIESESMVGNDIVKGSFWQ